MSARMKKGKKLQPDLSAGQRTITSFFGTSATGGKNKNKSCSSQNKVVGSGSKPEVKVKPVTVVNINDRGNEVIVVSDSDDDARDFETNKRSLVVDYENQTNESGSMQYGSMKKDTEIMNRKLIANGESHVLSSLEKSGNTPETDSGDELLSQLDIDEVIRNSQESLVVDRPVCSTPVKANEKSVEEPLYESNQMRTPTKSPKQKVNKFSPIRHLKKRARSNSSGRGESPRKGVTTPNKIQVKANISSSVSPKIRLFQDEPSTSTISPVKHNFTNSEPYYLRNFRVVIESVINDSYNDYLLHDDDKSTVTNFLNLSYAGKCLYVRLFLRKWDWKPVSAIKYPQISDNLEPIFDELCKAGFLTHIKDEVPPIEKLLDLLSASQIQSLAKDMKVDTTKKTKTACKSTLMKVANSQNNIFGSSSSSSLIVRKALLLMGKAYKLDNERRTIFTRMFILYSPPQYWEDEQEQTSNQLLRILLTDMGNMKYPEYTISKCIRIFPDRNGLIRFCNAWTLHNEMVAQIETKNWSDVKEICNEALNHFVTLFDCKETLQHDSSLPSFLRVYTPGSVYARTCWLGVDGYQKCKEYLKSNEVIATLLRPDNVYMCHYRGRWHERFVINMKHLKVPAAKVKNHIESALQEEHILDAHKLILSERLRKLHEECAKALERSSKKLKAEKDTEQISIDGPPELFNLKHEIPTMKIEGEKMDNQGRTQGGKSVFVGPRDASGNSTASSVEEFTINYFKSHEGYLYGAHAEGSIIVTLFGLLFWDEIYCFHMTDAFHTPYQPFPLDMNFEEFFDRRQSILLDKLHGMMTTWTIEDAQNLLDKNWNAHLDTLSIVSWNVFRSVNEAKSLLRAFGLRVVTKICERLLKNFRHCRSGFPDLIVWNENKALIVEVKGPGDSLSPKQMLWIDYLVEIGANIVVCHVASVSNKRIRLNHS